MTPKKRMAVSASGIHRTETRAQSVNMKWTFIEYLLNAGTVLRT